MSYNLTGAAQGGNFVLSRAGGATANISAITGAASSSTVQNVTFSNQGKLLYKATAAGVAAPATDAVTGLAFKPMVINQACALVYGLNAGGTLLLAQGLIVPYTDTSANSTRTPLPVMPDTVTPVAYVVIKNGATGASWTPGTGLWNATGIVVDTPVDVFATTAADPLTA